MFGSAGSRPWRRNRISPNLSSNQQATERQRLSIGQLGVPMVPTHRITLTSGTPITESDVTGATTIHLTPSGHDLVEIYDGYNWPVYQVPEQSLALTSNNAFSGYHQSGKNFFLGLFIHPSTGVLKFGSSVAWSSNTSTGTGAGTCEAELFQGRLVNKVSMTVRFGSASGDTATVPARQFVIFGGFRASADGQATDSLTKRYVSNLQNPTIRSFRVNDAAASWTYSTNTWRQSNGSTANQFEWFHCVAGRQVFAMNSQTTGSSTATFRLIALNIGIDTITNPPTGVGDNIGVSNATFYAVRGMYTGFPGIGYHYASSMELGAGTDTQTWYSNAGINFQLQGWTLN